MYLSHNAECTLNQHKHLHSISYSILLGLNAVGLNESSTCECECGCLGVCAFVAIAWVVTSRHRHNLCLENRILGKVIWIKWRFLKTIHLLLFCLVHSGVHFFLHTSDAWLFHNKITCWQHRWCVFFFFSLYLFATLFANYFKQIVSSEITE